MKKKKATQGGVRKNAGRKPVADKKKTVTVYIRGSVIERNGGIEKVREILTNVLS